jgi:ubiquinone/menaquinone biosynthesis C-methylase UbiE/DNA-binding transcriptional ArsR family regulator
MPEPLEHLKLLADTTRLRLLHLLRGEELSVAELQEVLDMGQSRISTHLGLLRQGGLVVDRRDGKRSFYALAKDLPESSVQLLAAAWQATTAEPEVAADRQNLRRILERRRRQSEQYFNEVAGRLGKRYCPGRSWEAIGHALLHLTPFIDIVDLGAGEGVLSQLLARQARQVYCIDSSPRMVEVGTELARAHGFENLHYKLGDIEAVPLPDASVDLALLSQALHHAEHPDRALAEAFRLLRPGGRVLVLDLKEHQFEKARELYADRWLGFTPNALHAWLQGAGFHQVSVDSVAREDQEPHFETLLGVGRKPSNGGR